MNGAAWTLRAQSAANRSGPPNAVRRSVQEGHSAARALHRPRAWPPPVSPPHLPLPPSQRRRRLAPSLAVHTLAFAWFASVFAWHLTPAAKGLPGAQGFGWFVRVLPS